MTISIKLAKHPRQSISQMKTELNTALEHIYAASQGLNRIVLANVMDHGPYTTTLVAIARIRGQLFDIWLDGALLVTNMQHIQAVEQELAKMTQERR